ncbi:hypothetical protein Vadar_008103 [Vaccinium darrowii]|uniref:Uncharacterized protein n=1 Tax=Vaccinium darrowii TaxID=229202 RepID=A0ACB7Z3B0_9ERIC|nr:hypothetical protein Vadar_008103 [Vaccinium darrowii]
MRMKLSDHERTAKLVDFVPLFVSRTGEVRRFQEHENFWRRWTNLSTKVKRSKPAAGLCSRCGGGASVADIKTATRFCYVPLYWKTWRAVICTFCGAVLRSYR